MIEQRYWCTECRRGYAEPGLCSVHADEALLDLAVPEVRLALEEQDDSGKQRHVAKLIGGVAVATVFVYVVVLLIVDYFDLSEYVNMIGVFFGTAIALYFAAVALFKFERGGPELSEEQLAALERIERGVVEDQPAAP